MWGCTSYFANHKIQKPKNTSYAGYLRFRAAASSRQGSQGPGCNFISWVGQCPERGGGYSRELLVGVCRLVLQILTLFQTKKIMPFSSLLLFELKRQMRLYTPVVPFIPDSRPKWVKSTPVFRPKRCKNYTLLGGTYLYGLYKKVPHPSHGVRAQRRVYWINFYGQAQSSFLCSHSALRDKTKTAMRET